jgi:hypothetical protein
MGIVVKSTPALREGAALALARPVLSLDGFNS